MTNLYSETRFISANEGNAEGKLGLHHLTAAIIEIATAHANRLHIGNPDMAGTDGGWVLSRLTVELYRYPAVNEEYKIETWIEACNRHFSERCFRFTDADGEVLGYARSIWMVINTKTHENMGLGHLNISADIIKGDTVPMERQAKHRPIVLTGEPAASTSLVTDIKPRKYRFKYCDIDYYRHVNTVRYIQLLLNQFTLQQMDESPVCRMELSFMNEASYGMTIDIMRYDDETTHTSTFTLCREGDHLHPLLFARLTRGI